MVLPSALRLMWMEKMRMHFEARWVQSARMRNIWQDSQPVPYTIRRTIHIHAPRHFANEEVASGYSRCEMSAVESARWLEMTDSKHRKAELLTTTSPRITPCVGLILLTETTVALALALNRCRQVQEEAKV